ncbi:MAG TPA: VOC family protein [Streptosporangiaceae bacterium]|nr:VOC family protein [Streptosporangiaceae bacterium]
MRIDRLDHLVLTVADIDATVVFYEQVLGMRAVTFGDGRRALAFGIRHRSGRPHPQRLPPRPRQQPHRDQQLRPARWGLPAPTASRTRGAAADRMPASSAAPATDA